MAIKSSLYPLTVSRIHWSEEILIKLGRNNDSRPPTCLCASLRAMLRSMLIPPLLKALGGREARMSKTLSVGLFEVGGDSVRGKGGVGTACAVRNLVSLVGGRSFEDVGGTAGRNCPACPRTGQEGPLEKTG